MIVLFAASMAVREQLVDILYLDLGRE